MGAIFLDGIDDSLTFSGSISHITDHPLTLAANFKTASDSPNFPTILAVAESVADTWATRHWAQQASKRLSGIHLVPGDENEVTTPTDFALATWHSVTAVFSLPQSKAVYGNGGNKGSSSAGFAGRIPDVLDRIAIGKLPNTSTQFLKGWVANAFLWNATLSDSDTTDWDNGSIPQSSSLIAAWDFTEAPSGGVYADKINSYDLTVNGATFDSGETYTGSVYTFDEPPVPAVPNLNIVTSPNIRY